MSLTRQLERLCRFRERYPDTTAMIDDLHCPWIHRNDIYARLGFADRVRLLWSGWLHVRLVQGFAARVKVIANEATVTVVAPSKVQKP